FDQQNFRILKVKPEYDYKKNISLIVTNNFDKELIKYFKEHEDSKCICIFLNKTDSINSIINTLKIADKSKVFCSKDSVKKLKKLDFDTYESIDLPLAKYNFFTSRFYSAVDIKLSSQKKPDILILTNNMPYTRVDPKTEAIQIYGRFRNGFKSLTHIALYDENITIMDDIAIEKKFKAMKDAYDAVSSEKNESMFDFDPISSETFRKQLEKLEYANYLDENNQLNHFAVDNLYYDNEVNSYYKSPDALNKAYEETNHFKVDYTPNVESEIFDIFKIKRLSIRKRRKEIVSHLERIESEVNEGLTTNEEKESLLKLFKGIDDIIVKAYYALGKTEIERHKYSATELENALKTHKEEKYRLSKEVADEVFKKFKSREGTPILKATIKADLKKVYVVLGIEFTVRLNTIEDYYDNPKTSGKNRTYTLMNRKKF
ncbi:MAG TPA: hypothetical protein DIT04_11100, partial [Dysgonomonas sp.]|nr:hypothetical protein [Dysgonomonas sp.]